MNDAVSLGIDLGTSELKAVLLDSAGAVLAHAAEGLGIARPEAGWSEQDPQDWWRACVAALERLRVEHPGAYAGIRCIGLSGQMHGAVLLDRQDQCVRPAILWDDSRSVVEAASLAQSYPAFSQVTGSLPMAGFTAPKLLWLKAHERQAFDAVDCVLSPKDYLRLRLAGERVTDVSDASGTLWLDVANRRWFEPMIRATGLELRQLPRLVEGTDVAGELRPSVAAMLNLQPNIVIAGGGGDNPASGAGIGAIEAGQSFITLGTSATVVSITDHQMSHAATGVHRYCHALPARWYAMGVILSGASCLRWMARLLSQPGEQELLRLAEQSVPADKPVPAGNPLFLPYLTGVRTPHNDPLARGGFVNLAHDTSAASLGYAVLEGVGFALRDAVNSVESAGAIVSGCALVGGGARSDYWAQLLSNILGRELQVLSGGELCASIGAARLGFSAYGYGPDIFRTGLSVKTTFIPARSHEATLQARYERFRALFAAVQTSR